MKMPQTTSFNENKSILDTTLLDNSAPGHDDRRALMLLFRFIDGCNTSQKATY